MKWSVLLAFALATTLMVGLPAVSAAEDDALQAGGERLVETQNTDGGWGWQLTGPSASNTIGPIATGLARGHWHTEDASFKTALALTGDFLLGKTAFSTSDGYLAMMLDSVFGGTTYRDHLSTNFYDKLADGTYERGGHHYDTEGYVNYIRSARSGTIANLAAWDIGMGLVGAAACGADTNAWIDGAKAEINELDSSGYYDVVGLAGALYGLAFVGEEFDPTTGEHAAASSLADLADILAGYQIAASGGFTWNANYLDPASGNETSQETGYAILALNEVDRMKYLATIQNAADWLVGFQLATGGWMNHTGSSSENNEITAEAMWGIHAVYLQDMSVGPGGDDSGFGYGFVPFASIQRGISMIQGLGGVVYVEPGVYAVPQIQIQGDVTIQGASPTITKLVSTEDAAVAWFLVKPDVSFHLVGVTLDGDGHNIRQAVRTQGSGSITSSIIENIRRSKYIGWGVALDWSEGGQDWLIADNIFRNIERVAILVDGAGNQATILDNLILGNGDGDWVGYGVEVGDGALAIIEGNTIKDYRGVASSDGSVSAGVLVTSFFGPDPEAQLQWNVLADSSYGIYVGYWDDDTSEVAARFNSISGNASYGLYSVGPLVNAALNWWGSADGPTHASNPGGGGDAVSDNVIFSPWLGMNPDGDPTLPGVQIMAPLYIVVAPVGPEPTDGYLNMAIVGANEIAGVGAHTVGVHGGTYDASEPITNPLSLLNEGGTAVGTVLTGPMSLDTGGVRLGRLGQGFTILGPITVGAGVDASTIHINWNCIFDAVINEGEKRLDARFNYWGDDGPETVGPVNVRPILPVCVDTIIEYMETHGLTAMEAILFATLMQNTGTLNALLVLQLIQLGYTEEQAWALIVEHGVPRVTRAVRSARGSYDRFALNLLGYSMGAPVGGGGGEDGGTEVYTVGDTVEITLDLVHPITGEPLTTGTATVSVFTTDEDGGKRFVALGIMYYSEEQGQFVYDLDTTGYGPGIYEIILGIPATDHHTFYIELVDPV